MCNDVSMKLTRLLFLKQKVIIFHSTLKIMPSPKLCLALSVIIIKNVSRKFFASEVTVNYLLVLLKKKKKTLRKNYFDKRISQYGFLKEPMLYSSTAKYFNLKYNFS